SSVTGVVSLARRRRAHSRPWGVDAISVRVYSSRRRFRSQETFRSGEVFMSPHVPDLPSEAEGLQFHAGLLSGDAAAPDEFAEHYLDWLIGRLCTANPLVDPNLCEQAAGDAIFTLIKNPQRFDPERGTLAAYLRMSSQGDLKNLLR